MKRTSFISLAAIAVFLCICIACLFGAGVLPLKETPTPPPSRNVTPEGSAIEVHFIDVGQADAALVVCDGKTMLIDGGNAEDSDLMYTYLQKHGVKHLDYVIVSHAHEDHVGGVSGALNYASVGTVFCPVTEYESSPFKSFKKCVEEAGCEISVPEVGDSFSLGSAEVHILGCNTTEDTNNSSIVMKIVHGNTSFLFTGDAEIEAEDIILDSGADVSATVLKVGHHGSYTSTGYRFLREVSPQYAVISCGKYNEYGHPHDEPLSRLRDADVTVFRTDVQGDVICIGDGENLTFTTSVSRGERVEERNDYVLNTYSFKYHLSGCENADSMNKRNRKEFEGTASELVAMGYDAAGCCE